ncbi:hypothetical protein [uncultured Ruegeria sp.]|uniref:hypothetical protein n=1 Tax=uncultured Ruegeria sp. TaxID=259304 RepID=UPI0026018B09|nr:hypothetical protein [uncultured Ruegeria sp.]
MSVVGREFTALFHSDLSCAGAEAASGAVTWWLTVSLAHFGIGIAVSSFVLFRGLSHGWLWLGIVGILLKEVAGDIPNSGFQAIVIMDSLWDLACYLIGFFVLWGLMISEKGGDE